MGELENNKRSKTKTPADKNGHTARKIETRKQQQNLQKNNNEFEDTQNINENCGHLRIDSDHDPGQDEYYSTTTHSLQDVSSKIEYSSNCSIASNVDANPANNYKDTQIAAHQSNLLVQKLQEDNYKQTKLIEYLQKQLDFKERELGLKQNEIANSAKQQQLLQEQVADLKQTLFNNQI